MRLAVVIITVSTVCLTEGQDTHCGPGEQCVHTDKCPPYLERRKLLNNYTPDDPEYGRLLLQLKSQVCNFPQRKVCCAQPAEDVALSSEECGQQQMTSGFVRLDKMQSWF